MNALVRKEIRLLLPSFVAALLLSLSIWLMPNRPNPTSGWQTFITVMPFLLCPAMALMMALESFGRELSAGTFPQLLALPVSRPRIWNTKTALLGIALLTVLTAWVVSFALHFRERLAISEGGELRRTMILAPALYALVVFSGALWSVLLLRQVAAAFWFTLIVPAALLMPFFYFMEGHPSAARNAIIAVLVLYSVAGFFFGRRLFLNAQDLQPTGGNIALPEWRSFLRRREKGGRSYRPRRALWIKELQLHQSHFIIAGVLALLHIAVLATRKFGDFRNSQALLFTLEAFWMLWFAMPLVIGCAAVAEERKLGVLESQLCLPTGWRTQFRVKLCATLLLSLLFGVGMPLLLEGDRIVPNLSFELTDYALIMPDGKMLMVGETLRLLVELLPAFLLLCIAASIALTSLYASTLSRNTLQALGPGVLGLLLTWAAVVSAGHPQAVVGFPLWRGPLIYFIGVPVTLTALLALMYWNFKHVLVTAKLLRRNALVLTLSLAFVVTATAGIYHRAWELLPFREPAHGPARFTRESVKLKSVVFGVVAQFSDGRAWCAVPWHVPLQQGGFFDGTNWAHLEVASVHVIGLQKDGSLWALPNQNVFASNTVAKQSWTQRFRTRACDRLAMGGG